MARIFVVLLVLLGLLAATLAWSGRTQESRADFAFINRGDNKSLDPNNMSWMQDIRLAYGLWEGFYTLDPVTLRPILGSAESAQVSPDQLTWTFHIRPDAKWSNGEPLKAGDFLFEWRRMLETPGEYSYLHHYIAGAEEYEGAFGDYLAARDDGKPATPPDFASVGEKVLDDRTFQVRLKHPVPFFPSLCAFPPFYPMYQPCMDKPAYVSLDAKTGLKTYDLAFTRPPNLVTNGPYRLAEWTFKQRVRLIANDYYWDRAHVKSRVIDQIYDDEPLTAYRLYQQNDVDWVADVDPEIVAGILHKGGRDDLHVFPGFGTYYYEFNCSPKLPDGRDNPLADIRVRQALTMAIDKEQIVREVARMGQPITSDYIPPGVFPGYKAPPGLPYDPTRAKQLLAEAGYPDGKGFPRLSILFNTESTHGDIATVIHRQWLDKLGIDCDLEGVEVKVFGFRKHAHDFEIGRSGWFGDYYDPSTFTDKYLSNSDDNDPQWKSKPYDDLCAAAALETDPQKRLDLLSQAENILLNEASIMPLYTYVGAYLTHDNVRGVPLDPQEMLMFKAVQVLRN